MLSKYHALLYRATVLGVMLQRTTQRTTQKELKNQKLYSVVCCCTTCAHWIGISTNPGSILVTGELSRTIQIESWSALNFYSVLEGEICPDNSTIIWSNRSPTVHS